MQINNDGRIIMTDLPVHEFLAYITQSYKNDYGVKIRTNLFEEDREPETEDYISVSACWNTKAPAMPFHDEEVVARFCCSTIDQFMQAFKIDDAMGINAITPGQLMELYQQGKATIECTVSHLYDDYSLHFSLTPPEEEPEEDEPTVEAWLHTPEQFIQYTRQYFRLDEIPVSEREKLEYGVYKYLMEDDPFNNKWDVEFSIDDEEFGEKHIEYTLTISAAWPSFSDNTGTTDLVVKYEGFGAEELIDFFGITSANELAEITPIQLQQLYYQGKACIFCWLEEHDDMLFFKLQRDGSMLAAKYFIGKEEPKGLHEVPELLQTAEQFIEYTRQYWRYARLF